MILNRQLTIEEEPTIIAIVNIGEQIVYFQQGDEELYLTYLSEVERLQQEYINNLNQIIANLQ